VDPTLPNLGHRTIIAALQLGSEFGYLAAFSNAGGSNLSDVLNDAKFRFFDPPPVKIRGGVGEIPIPIVEALSTTDPPKYI